MTGYHCWQATRRARFAAHALAALLGSGLLFGAPAGGGEPAGAGRVAVLCQTRGPYRPAADAIVAGVRAGGWECVLVELPEDDAGQREAVERLSKLQPVLVATGGATATTQALAWIADVPVVFFMVPNALDAAFLEPGRPYRARVAGVSSDVAPAEQLDWIARTRRGIKRIALLSSSRTRRTATALEQAGRERGIEVVTIQAARDAFPTAIEALNANHCEGVLMIPDAQVYNSPNVERLLLWGVRSKKPVWTFSENVVKAGAFAGLYCDSEAVGAQTAKLINDILSGSRAEQIGLRHVQQVGRAVNVHVAQMIGADLNSLGLDASVKRFGEDK